LLHCRPPSPSAFCTLSLHDALPIFLLELGPDSAQLVPGVGESRGTGLPEPVLAVVPRRVDRAERDRLPAVVDDAGPAIELVESRSEEHTSELQSRFDLVCRLLLENK